MKDFWKKTGWTDILMSIIFALIGIFMIVKTDSATKIISYVIGGIFIGIGLIRVIDYWLLKEHDEFYNYDLFYGIVAIIVGIVTICCSNLIESIFRIVIGIWIIYSGMIRLSLSLKLHKANLSIWTASLILSIIIIIGGIYMLLQNGALVLTVGIVILVYAISDLIESIIFMKYVNELL